METHSEVTGQFGVHMMIEGYGAVAARLHDKTVLSGLLEELPGEIGMHRICSAIVVEAGLRHPVEDATATAPRGLQTSTAIA